MNINNGPIHKTINRLYHSTLLRYALIGGVSTLIHISVAFCLIYFAQAGIYAANIVGFVTAYLFSYTFQSIFVFRHALSVHKAIRYFVIQFASLIISTILSNLFYYNPYIKTLLIIILMPLLTYITHKFWTFKTKQGNENEDF